MKFILSQIIYPAMASVALPSGVACIVNSWPEFHFGGGSAYAVFVMAIGVWSSLCGINWALTFLLSGIEVKGSQAINIALIQPPKSEEPQA